MRRLLALRREGKLTTGQVRSVAAVLGVRERAVWRWLAAADQDEAAAAAPGERAVYHGRFTVTDEVRALLAVWKGNVAAVHRELTAHAARGEGQPPPSIPTLHRAIRRDLSPGERAGLAGGEREARKHDVFLARPRGWRNQVWETDHMQAPVLVDVDDGLAEKITAKLAAAADAAERALALYEEALALGGPPADPARAEADLARLAKAGRILAKQTRIPGTQALLTP
ncbi:hypothetical protein [Streptomyces hydrogenans]|uniref:hypothetical protein n=1 Tax=Streptomyces hydrogenans TaxID=1873719 RepID=UPI0035D9C014